ncbi:IS3 family transposase [Paenibacillus xylaniclasticus]|uniref:IS3 family transposase n=1 Tax=Paenibacillus xylaniclasticus TaxID=588083 RepID=UPI0013DF4E63
MPRSTYYYRLQHPERTFHSILERECYTRNCFGTYEEAFAEVDRFISYYNHRRIHGSLMDLPPVEYMRLFKQGEIMPKEIAL